MKKIFFTLFISVWLTHDKCLSQTFIPDTTINALLKLEDFESIEKYLGDIMAKTDSEAPLPDIYFTNKFSTQYLRLIFFPGGTRNSFARFEIGIKPISKKYVVLKKYVSFKTESNIRIGSSLSSVVTKKGKSYKQNNTGSVTVLSYEISDISQYPFLQRHNMPLYSAKYYFKRKRLFKMSYGFEYP
jgi:hypothetical protein